MRLLDTLRGKAKGEVGQGAHGGHEPHPACVIPEFADGKGRPLWTLEERPDSPGFRYLHVDVPRVAEFLRHCESVGVTPTLEAAYSDDRRDAWDRASYAVTEGQYERVAERPWHAEREHGDEVHFAVRARDAADFVDHCGECRVQPVLRGAYPSSAAEEGTWDTAVYSMPKAAADRVRSAVGTRDAGR